MGNICGMDTYQRLMSEHHQTFCKIITTNESKKVVDQKVPEIKIKVAQYYNQFEIQSCKKVDQNAKSASDYLEKQKQDLRDKYAFEIQKYQMLSQSKIQDQFLFVQEFKDIESSKEQAKKMILNKKEQILKQIDIKHQHYMNSLESQKPKLQLYDTLEPEVKKQIDIKAIQMFNDKIQAEKSLTITELQKSMGLQKYKQILKTFDVNDKLNEKINILKEKVTINIENLTLMIQGKLEYSKLSLVNKRSSGTSI